MTFIRIGTDVTAVAQSQPFIRRAKERGLFVMANLMKSYAVPACGFAAAAQAAAAYGAEVVYLVDSAGCMFPEQVAEYVDALRESSGVALGFHGHDNLRLALGNSLRMVEHGATFIDGSLQGLGRSAGNAVTEVLVAALEKRGYATGIDLLRTLQIGDTWIRPLVPGPGMRTLDVIAGYAGFHSGFQSQVLRVAETHQIDAARLIIELCRVTQLDADEEVLHRLAHQIRHADVIARPAEASTLAT
jgi:4-hydroxy-2-oxovalerate aldolase